MLPAVPLLGYGSEMRIVINSKTPLLSAVPLTTAFENQSAISTAPPHQVVSITPSMDLAEIRGRVDMVCTLVNCYRVLVAMADALPALELRTPLWKSEVRDTSEVMLNPKGAYKVVRRFKQFLRGTGSAFEVLEAAYHAAGMAAAEHPRRGTLPFLVTAPAGPAKQTRDCYSVQTEPLGYNSRPTSELVSWNTCPAGTGCCHCGPLCCAPHGLPGSLNCCASSDVILVLP